MSIQSNINQTMMVAASLASAIKSMDELDKLTNKQQSRIVDKYKKVKESSGLRGALEPLKELANKDVKDLKGVDTTNITALDESMMQPSDDSTTDKKDYEKLMKIMSSTELSSESKKKLTGLDLNPDEAIQYDTEVIRSNLGEFDNSKYTDFLAKLRNKSKNAVNEVNMRSLHSKGYDIDNITTYDDWGSID